MQQIRCELEAAWLHVLRTAVASLEGGDTIAARGALSFLLQAAPSDELGHRTLMTFDLRAGRLHQVLRQYEDCARSMAQTHGLQPSAAIVSLAFEASQRLAAMAAAQPHLRYRPPDEVLPLIGREAEVQRISELLQSAEASVVTLVGAGGVGKTRVAAEVAWRLRNAFDDGVFWVNLRTTTDAADALATVSSALEAAPDGAGSTVASVRRILAMRRMLLVLDNADHQCCGEDSITQIIAAGGAARVMITRQLPLAIARETSVLLNPLGVPRRDGATGTLLTSSAVQLFLQRMPIAASTLSDDVLADIGELVADLDGNPLAIELAAARMVFETPVELMRLLEQGLEALDRGPVDLEPHHRSISAVLDLSAKQLSPVAQVLHRNASLFAAQFTTDDLRALAFGDTGSEVDLTEALDELTATRLLSPLSEGSGWFMPRVARRHAELLLRQLNEGSWLTLRYIEWIEQRIAHVIGTLWHRDQAAAADRFDAWRADISMALRRAHELQHGLLVSMVANLGDYWLLRSETLLGLRWTDHAIRLLGMQGAELDPANKARLHVCRARLLLARVEVEPARLAAAQALSLAQLAEREDVIADAVECGVAAALRSGAVHGATQLAEQWIPRLERAATPAFWRLLAQYNNAVARSGVQSVQCRSADYARLRSELAGTQTLLAISLGEWGLLFSRGEWITAHAVALQSYDLAVRLRSPQMIVASSTRQALAEYAMDDLDAALSSARRARALAHDVGLEALAAAAAGIEVDILLRSDRSQEAAAVLSSVADVMCAERHGSLRSIWLVLAAYLAIEDGDPDRASLLLLNLASDEKLQTGAGTLLAMGEVALAIAVARGAEHFAIELRWLIQRLDAARLSPRKPAEWRWLARHDRLATPLSEPPARAMPPAELLAQLKRVAQEFAFDQARLPTAS